MNKDIAMFRLNEKSKKAIERSTGIKYEVLEQSDLDTLEEQIETKIGKRLTYSSSKDKRLLGRGNVYMFLGRLVGMDVIDKKLSKI